MPGGKRTHSYKTVHCTHTTYPSTGLEEKKSKPGVYCDPSCNPVRDRACGNVFSQHAHALSHSPVLTLISSQLYELARNSKYKQLP